MPRKAEAMSAGRIGRAHGLDGSFYVTGAIPRLLAAGTSVTVGERQTKVIRRAGADARPIVKVHGIEDRVAAEAARGLELTVAAEDAPGLGEGEWWAGELQGCEVYDGETRVGVVRGLQELPSCEALQVTLESAQGDGGEGVKRSGSPDPGRPGSRAERELLVPMVRDAIRGVDVRRRRIDVDMSFLEEAYRSPVDGTADRPARGVASWR